MALCQIIVRGPGVSCHQGFCLFCIGITVGEAGLRGLTSHLVANGSAQHQLVACSRLAFETCVKAVAQQHLPQGTSASLVHLKVGL